MRALILSMINFLAIPEIMADPPKDSKVDRFLKDYEAARDKELSSLEKEIKRVFGNKKLDDDAFRLAKKLCEAQAWLSEIDREEIGPLFGADRVFKISKRIYAVALSQDVKTEDASKEMPSKIGNQWFLLLEFDSDGQKALNDGQLNFSSVDRLKVRFAS
jgi:hypothetical protein